MAFDKLSRRLAALTGLTETELCDPNALQPNDPRHAAAGAGPGPAAGAAAAGAGAGAGAGVPSGANASSWVSPHEPLVVVLLSGSFNPVHTAHVGVLRLARAELERHGFRGVALGVLAPSSDDYVRGKLGAHNTMALHHRTELCRLATTTVTAPLPAAAPAAATAAVTVAGPAHAVAAATAVSAAGVGGGTLAAAVLVPVAATAPAVSLSAGDAKKGTATVDDAKASTAAAASAGASGSVVLSASDAEWLDACGLGIPSASTTCERVLASAQQRFPAVAHRLFVWELCGADHLMKYALWRRGTKHLLAVGRPGYMTELARAMTADSFTPPDPAAFRAALLAHVASIDAARAAGKHLAPGHWAERLRKLPRLFALISDGSAELSSTEIRKRLSGSTPQQRAADFAWLIANGWVHPAVLEYIESVGPALYLKPSPPHK